MEKVVSFCNFQAKFHHPLTITCPPSHWMETIMFLLVKWREGTSPAPGPYLETVVKPNGR